jgi:hypothetical protein
VQPERAAGVERLRDELRGDRRYIAAARAQRGAAEVGNPPAPSCPHKDSMINGPIVLLCQTGLHTARTRSCSYFSCSGGSSNTLWPPPRAVQSLASVQIQLAQLGHIGERIRPSNWHRPVIVIVDIVARLTFIGVPRVSFLT